MVSERPAVIGNFYCLNRSMSTLAALAPSLPPTFSGVSSGAKPACIPCHPPLSLPIPDLFVGMEAPTITTRTSWHLHYLSRFSPSSVPHFFPLFHPFCSSI